MVFGATDASHRAIIWVTSELRRYPRVMIQVQKELEMVIGDKAIVEKLISLSWITYIWVLWPYIVVITFPKHDCVFVSASPSSLSWKIKPRPSQVTEHGQQQKGNKELVTPRLRFFFTESNNS
ncbi:hypothetical protein POM88_025814 [Heracleum sosnowskyi]|uniref:Cytochrome P450 n=1 Tax=Heracleum sosnowskyi TaxID=360622 RepID=A0AAD8I5P6_9APIA|nr:hypothetical protein POM88_025814 [Heracleum sosnowskyi]